MNKFLSEKQLLIIVFFLSMGFICFGYGELADTGTYISAWENYLSKGVLDPCRTPLYPLLIGGCSKVLGMTCYKYGVIFVQHIVCVVSSVVLFKLSCQLKIGIKLSFGTAIAYMLLADATWNNFIMTESLACSGTIFVTYYTMRLFYDVSIKNSVLLFFSLLFVVTLRPAQIYLIAVVGLMSMVLVRKRDFRRSAIYAFASCGGVCLLIGLYANQFNRTYGFWGISDVTDINQYYMLRSERIVTPVELGGVKSVQNEERLLRGDDAVIYEEAGELLEELGYGEFHRKIGIVKQEHQRLLVKKCIGRFFRAKDSVLFEHFRAPVISSIGQLFSPHFNFVYCTLIIFFLFVCMKCCSEDLLEAFFLIFAILANVVTIIIGAQSGWGRLAYPSMPILLLIYSIIFNKIEMSQ